MKAQELQELATYRKDSVYAGAHVIWQKANDYYEQRDNVPVPKALNAEAVHLNTARKIVDTGDHNYMKDNPVTEVRPSGRSVASEARARDTQLVFDACLKEMLMPVIKTAPKKLLLRGVGILGLWFNEDFYGVDKQGWTREDEDEFSDRALWDFPLKFTCYDPMNCYPSRAMQNSFQPRDMLVMYEITTAEGMALVENHPSWKWKPKPDEQTVTFIDYYTNKSRVVMIGEKKVYDGPNALGFVPFVIIPAGFGQSSYQGKVEEEWRPIFYGEMELLTSEQIEYSARRAILLKKAWGQTEVIGEPETVANQFPGGIPTSPDTPIVHTADVELKPIEAKGPDHTWAEGQAITASYIDAPNEMSGARTSGVYSARHAEDLLSHQRTRYKDALMNLQRGLEHYLRMCGQALKVLGNEVSVRALDEGKAVVRSVSPDRIDDRCEVKVKLVSETPEAQSLKRSQGLAEWQAGAIDRQTMHTQFMDMSIDESERVTDRRLLDDYMEQPFMKQLLTAMIAKEKGDLLTAQMALMQFQAERGGANNVTARTGSEMVPQSGVQPEGAMTAQETVVQQ